MGAIAVEGVNSRLYRRLPLDRRRRLLPDRNEDTVGDSSRRTQSLSVPEVEPPPLSWGPTENIEQIELFVVAPEPNWEWKVQ
ncbi:hypothetical protein [Halobaculum sp. MBLA0143]|uniref:hypothetical protein n=1 Tax=Halobaculum sp. MBLA0143 TaxID=3079933 RepID=UPI003526C2D3